MIIKKFKEQAELIPDKAAIVTSEKSYSYSELDKKSDAISNAIGKSQDSQIIALLLGHSADMILAMLGVLKKGKAYISMDSTYPYKRLNYMLVNAQARIIVTNKENIALANDLVDGIDYPIEIINVDNISPSANNGDYQGSKGDDLAYILYTSGSTNKPKGVMQTQRNIIHFIDSYTETLSITSKDRLTLFSSFSHDAAVMDVYGALLNGATLYPIDVKKIKDFNEISQWISDNKITVWHSVPTFFRYFINNMTVSEKLNTLRLIVLGGEALLKRDIEKFQEHFDQTLLYNLYGQTESSFNCGQFINTNDVIDRLLLGLPVSDTEIFIVDEDGLEVEPFEEGEILIASPYVSTGYWQDEIASKSAFSKNDEFGTIYKTGDYGKLLLNGDIEFMGRKDNQIKIRGYRVELGAIESELLRITGIKEAVVISQKDASDENVLTAYIVIDNEITTASIRTGLRNELPDYMLPSHYNMLDKIPLLPNGKTDRKALKDMDGKQLEIGSDYQKPTTDLENTISRLFKEELSIDRVGINDNFFDLGAHSLNIVMINNKLNETLDIELAVTQMFEFSTVKKLADHIEWMTNGTKEEVTVEVKKEKKKRAISRASNDIAIIGMSGRFPGANSIGSFWNNLIEGKESISFFTDSELKEMGIEDETLSNPNYIKAKGVVENIEYFDASFFGYTPKDAKMMDPQMRLFHECSWEALEDAGYVSESYKGRIGLYTGASNNLQWQVMNILSGEMGSSESFAARHFFDKDYISTRLSYKLNLQGPCYNVQTACSTSLATIDMACKDLILGECDMAMAGGASIGLPNKSGYMYEKGMILSEDGHCRAFDEKASGTVFGDGIGVVLLKRLEDAIADNDNVYAVVKGSATNNDGSRKIGYTAPSIEGQIEVIRAAQEAAGISAESVTYIETHGTGTALGDPIEIEALKRSFNTDKKGFCAVGSVKSNIGHLNVASGIAGFLKTALAIKNQKLPASLHFETPNPKIDFETSPFYVNTELREWKNDEFPLRAGISSLGIGGTNTHIVLEAAPPVENSSKGNTTSLITLSAKTKSALASMTDNLVAELHNNKECNLLDAAYTLQVGRKEFKNRRSLVASTVEEAIERLGDLNSKYCKTNEAKDLNRNIVFMFTGQGAQYINMGKNLYEKQETFRKEMDACFDILDQTLGCNAKEILYPTSETSREIYDINETQYTQPLLFSYEYALAKQLMAFGIKAKAMIGHSLGEYVAACIAGVFSLEDALSLVSMRGKLMQSANRGSMMMVEATEDELQEQLDEDISIAAINSAKKIVVSGTDEAISALEKKLLIDGYTVRKLITSHAFHSDMMTPILESFESEISKIDLKKPEIAFISNMTGTWIEEKEAMSTHYWTQHIRETVRFNDGMNVLMDEEDGVFIEVGPGRTLSTFARKNDNRRPGHYVLNLSRHIQEDVDDTIYLLDKIGQLWTHGVDVNWSELHAGQARKRISLPTYPFERSYYWTKEYHLNALMKKMGNGMDINETYLEDENELSKNEDTTVHDNADRYERPELSSDYEASRDDIEAILVDICSEIMEIDKIGINDDFFELGGDSLGAITLCGKIQAKLNVEITVVDIFQSPTVAEIAELVRETQATSHLTIEKASEKEYYVASPAQRRLYTLQQLDLESTAYNLPGTFLIEGAVESEKIEKIFTELINRHEALRTSFGDVEGEPVQYINEDVDFKLTIMDQDNTDTEKLINESIKSFDLSNKSLFRASLIKLKENKTLLIIDMHHIISDGISLGILMKEFSELYLDRVLKPLTIQYKDYSEWLVDTLEKDNQKSYWLEKFNSEIPILNLIGDNPRPSGKSYEGDRLSFRLSSDLNDKVRQACKKSDVTLYMLLLAVYNVLLSKYTDQEDIIIGSPIAGRHSGDLNDIMGIFVNTLPMRNYPRKDKTFKNFLLEVKENALGAYEHQDYPFESLVKELNVKRDMSRNPLFDVMFTMLSMTKSDQMIEGLSIRPYDYQYNNSKVDMELLISDNKDSMDVEIVYARKIFNKSTIKRFANHYEHVLEQLVDNMNMKLSSIELVNNKEKEQLINGFNNTEIAFPRDKTIYQLFEEQVEKAPDRIAVSYGERSYSYRELNNRSNQLARLIVSKGVQRDSIVGIMVERSLEMIVGIMAIVKAGGAYLPIDPLYPSDRIKFMIEDSDVKLLLTQSWLCESTDYCEELLILDKADLYEGDKSNLELQSDSSALAYVIYTSGSTGNPKGVMIQHNSLVNRLNWMQRQYPIGEEDVILQKTPFTFDVSVWEIFWWSTVGASVHMLEQGGEKNPELLANSIYKNNITTMHFVPSMLNIFLEYVRNNSDKCQFGLLNQVFASGEALMMNHVENFESFISMPYKTKLINLYGPTEATVDVTYYDCHQENMKHSVPIGKPIDNTRIYILNKSLNLMPIGVPGELCIAGDGLARGYQNRPELTAEKFIDNPYEIGKKLYRTGDLVRWSEDGNIEYLGRIDFQVKVRGYRIELGEIESKLQNHDGIKESVVIDRCDETGNKYLCAYIVTENEVTIQSLKEHLNKDLPEYMIPSYFVKLETLPLSSNGKIDRKALPEATHNLETGTVYVGPENEVQYEILTVWKEVLKNDKIGITDDFFSLGGDSFKALNVVSKLSDMISLADIFQYPTVELLWTHVIAGDREESLLNRLTHFDEADENESAIVCVPYGGGSSIIYKPLADEIESSELRTDLYAINIPGHDSSGSENLDSVLNVAKKCADEIKHTIGKPVLLYGHCVGVALTLEIVRLLEQDNYPVIGIGVGAVLPVRKNVFGSPKIDIYEGKSNEDVHKFLKSLGGFDYPMEVEELASLMVSFRHDVTEMRKYFYIDYIEMTTQKLKAPLYNIIGDQDRLTRSYVKGYKKWMAYAESVKVPIVLDDAGHYFLKSHAKELAMTLTQIVVENETTENFELSN